MYTKLVRAARDRVEVNTGIPVAAFNDLPASLSRLAMFVADQLPRAIIEVNS
jgi:hypothetical protein